MDLGANPCGAQEGFLGAETRMPCGKARADERESANVRTCEALARFAAKHGIRFTFSTSTAEPQPQQEPQPQPRSTTRPTAAASAAAAAAQITGPQPQPTGAAAAVTATARWACHGTHRLARPSLAGMPSGGVRECKMLGTLETDGALATPCYRHTHAFHPRR